MNSMDDTYKRLKGLTQEEAEYRYTEIYCRLEEISPNGHSQGASQKKMVECVNKELGPYGWPYSRFWERQ